MQTPKYRLLNKEDLSEIIKFMDEMKPTVAGMQSREIYEPFCHYVMETDKVVYAVAELENQIIGFSITIIDYNSFWRKFLANHILLSLKIVFKKFIKFLKHNRSIQLSSEPVDISKYLSKHNTNRSWKDSSPVIAKVLYIAVKKDYRQKGIGKGLYKFRHKILLQKGVKRVDGKISHQNIAPIKLAYAEGRQIVRESNGMLFTTFDIK